MITFCHFSLQAQNINFKDRNHVSFNLVSSVPRGGLNKYLLDE